MRTLVTVTVITTAAACAHRAPPPVAPVDGNPGRPEDRLELGSRYSTSSRPSREGLYRGGRPVTLDEFLRVAGRGEAADAIATRQWVKRGLMIGGIATLAGAIAHTSTVDDCDPDGFVFDRDFQACQLDRKESRWLGVGVGLGGAALFLIGLELGNQHPSWDELSLWAATHNRTHRIPPPTTRREVRIAPTVGPGGGGVVMTGRF